MKKNQEYLLTMVNVIVNNNWQQYNQIAETDVWRKCADF